MNLNIIKKPLLLLATVISLTYIVQSEFVSRLINLTSKQTVLDLHFQNNFHSPDTTIVLINTAGFDSDSIIKAVQVISKFQPAVVGVDHIFYRTDEDTTDTDYVTLVLPIALDDNDDVLISNNIIQNTASYGSVTLENTQKFNKTEEVNGQLYNSFGLELLKYFDPEAFDQAMRRSHQTEYINYVGNAWKFYILDLQDVLDTIFLERVENKIVIFGYLGNSADHIPNQDDCNDSHDSPLGLIYGPLIIANIIHTLNGNFIDYNLVVNLLLIGLAAALFIFILSKMSHLSLWKLVLISHGLLAFLFFALPYLSFYILSQFSYLIDHQSMIISLILAVELMILILYKKA